MGQYWVSRSRASHVALMMAIQRSILERLWRRSSIHGGPRVVMTVAEETPGCRRLRLPAERIEGAGRLLLMLLLREGLSSWSECGTAEERALWRNRPAGDFWLVRRRQRSPRENQPSILGSSLHHDVVRASRRNVARTRTGQESLEGASSVS